MVLTFEHICLSAISMFNLKGFKDVNAYIINFKNIFVKIAIVQDHIVNYNGLNVYICFD